MPMHALARLITDVMATHEWNQADVGRRAGITRQRIGQLINEPVKAVPDRETIAKLARGLSVPPWVVMDAYLETLGLPTRPTHVTVEESVNADVSLSVAGKAAVLAVVTHMRHQPEFPATQGHLTDEPRRSREPARETQTGA